MKRPWKVRPTHPVFRMRSFADEDRASRAAHALVLRFGVSCEILHGDAVQYEVYSLFGDD